MVHINITMQISVVRHYNLSSTRSFPDFSALRDFVAHNVPTNHYFEIQPLTPEFVLTELTHLKCTAAGFG